MGTLMLSAAEEEEDVPFTFTIGGGKASSWNVRFTAGVATLGGEQSRVTGRSDRDAARRRPSMLLYLLKEKMRGSLNPV